MGAENSKQQIPVNVQSELITISGDVPPGREGSSAVFTNDGLLMFGGGREGDQLNDLHCLNVSSKVWTQLPATGSLPSARAGHSMVHVQSSSTESKIIVIGGLSSTDGYLNDVIMFDPSSKIWSIPKISGSPPQPADKRAVAVVGSKIYVFGGFGPSPSDPEEEDDRDEDDDDNDSEEENNDDDDNESKQETGAAASFTWFGDLHCLDTLTWQWSRLATSGVGPSPRAACGMVALLPQDNQAASSPGRLVVFGGRDSQGRQADTYVLDLEGDLKWIRVADETPLPTPRSFHSVCAMQTASGVNAVLSYGGISDKGEPIAESLEVLNMREEKPRWRPIEGFAKFGETKSRHDKRS